MFNQIFTYQYLFGATIPPFKDQTYLIIAGVLILAAIVLAFLGRSKNPITKELIKKWYHMALTIGIIGLIWSFFRYELVRFWSMHFWVLLNYFLGIIWAAWILKYQFGTYRARKSEFERNNLRSKYL